MASNDFISCQPFNKPNDSILYDNKFSKIDNKFSKIEKNTVGIIKINKNQLHIDFLPKNIKNRFIIAGGHILNAIIGDNESSESGDIDIFIIQDSESSLTNVRGDIIKLVDNIKNYYYDKEIVLGELLNSSCINLIVKNAFNSLITDEWIDIRIQIITFKLFLNVEQLLSIIDLDNCKVAYLDGKIYTTKNFETYLEEYEINYNPDENNSLYKSRVLKYSKREYNIMIPNKTKISNNHFWKDYYNKNNSKFNLETSRKWVGKSFKDLEINDFLYL